MSKSIFKFKQFSLSQQKSAMKIGTDGVLLGAWSSAQNPKSILDVGSGTGLIGLMLAQRFKEAEITGIDNDPDAFEETKFNYANSPFSERCSVVFSSLQNFETTKKFDLIVSNPPFFIPTHSDGSSRSRARQQSELNFEDLIEGCHQLMNINSRCAFIIPFEGEKKLTEIAENFSLYPEKICRVKGNQTAKYKRSLIQFSAEKSEIKSEELIIEISRNIYTPDYIYLTKDFYLKM